MKNELTQEELKRRIQYDPDTGIARWITTDRKGMAGKIAGTIKPDGYVFIKIGKYIYPMARIIHLYMTGKFPDGEMDHINRIRSDNRWNNLREATRMQNAANVKVKSSTGYKGVTRSIGKFQARIMIDGKIKYLGTRSTAYKASLLYNEAAAKQFGEFACTGSVEQIADGKKSVDAAVENEIQAVRVEQNHL